MNQTVSISAGILALTALAAVAHPALSIRLCDALGDHPALPGLILRYLEG